MVPEASSGCMCPFPNACTIVFKSKESEAENRQWARFSQPGELTPVKHLALNLGAPGDRRDDSGSLWLGYPRPGGSLVLQWRAAFLLLSGGGYFRHDPARLEIEGDDTPWVFRSGLRGLRQCTLPVAGSLPGQRNTESNQRKHRVVRRALRFARPSSAARISRSLRCAVPHRSRGS